MLDKTITAPAASEAHHREAPVAKSATETLADFAAEIRFEDLPAEVVHATKRLILDTLACTIASHCTEAGKIIVDVRQEMGGKPESTILVTGEKTSCANAAYVNAWLANLMDFDDTNNKGSGHFGSCAVLPALATAERVGASGKNLITAVAVGFEVTSRIGASLAANTRANPVTGKMELTGVAGQSWGVFSAAAAAGRLLGLDGVGMAHALGLAGYSAPVPTIGKASSNAGKWGEGCPPAGGWQMTKYTHYGAIAEAGVIGALLAHRGFTGDRTVLDGDRGFWMMIGSGGFNIDTAIKNLGKTWDIGGTSFKHYPTCRFTHHPIALFEKLMRENKLRPEEVERVDVGVVAHVHKNMGEQPVHNEMDTQMTLLHPFAMIALGKAPGPEWMNPELFADPRVLAFSAKVKVHLWPEADDIVVREQAAGARRSSPCKVDITARGTTFRGEARYAPGDPWDPEYESSDEDLTVKFRNSANGLLPSDTIEQAIKAIYSLETLAHVDGLVRHLA